MSMNNSRTLTDGVTAAAVAEGAARRRLRDWISRWRSAVLSRQALRRLLALDDRMLADIGLTRGDVELALREPVSADVQGFLAQCRADNLELDAPRHLVR